MFNKKENLPSIVFFGTPEFARFCLEYLIEKRFNIKGVVTAPDRKAGRGKKVKSSSVKIYSEKMGLKIFQPLNLSDSFFISQLQNLSAETYVVVAFRMLPKKVWTIPPLGTINLHASLLPDYRGAAPINWVMINGESKTGVTTFLINENIDTGALLMQDKIYIEDNFCAGDIYDKLLDIGAPLIVQTLINLKKGNLIPKKQKELKKLNDAPKLTSQNTRINWNLTLTQINNLIRGLSPYPGAWTEYSIDNVTTRIKIFKAKIVIKSHNHKINTLIVEDNNIFIAHKEGLLNCIEIQLPNKKRMIAKDLLNGYIFSESTYVL